MHTLRNRLVVLVASLMAALAPRFAAAADCELAIQFATIVVDRGQQAMASRNFVAATDFASSARIPAIDAAQQAKACGCPEAMPLLAEAALDAARVNTAFNLTAVQQFGGKIRKKGEAALETLRRCAGPPLPGAPR